LKRPQLSAAVALQKKAIGPKSRGLVTAATSAEFLRSLSANEIAVGLEVAEQCGSYDLILEGVGGNRYLTIATLGSFRASTGR